MQIQACLVSTVYCAWFFFFGDVTFSYAHWERRYIYIHINIYIYTYIYMEYKVTCTYMYVCMYACMYVCMYIYRQKKRIQSHVCLIICVWNIWITKSRCSSFIHTQTHTHTHTHTHKHKQTHTHTHTQQWLEAQFV
jgi:hypothetical protein